MDLLSYLIDFDNLLKGKIMKKLCLLLWLSVAWSIWFTRNDTLFKGGYKGEYDIVVLAKSLAWDWLGAKSKESIGCELED